jgi:hypothetical protein
VANNLIISTAARNAALDAVTALLNVGGAGTIDIYDGVQPANPGTAVTTQNKLVTLTFSTTAFAASSGGSAVANAITSGTAIATGTPAWARLKSGAATAVIDCTVGTSGTDLVLASASISTGNSVSCSSWTLTHPQ